MTDLSFHDQDWTRKRCPLLFAYLTSCSQTTPVFRNIYEYLKDLFSQSLSLGLMRKGERLRVFWAAGIETLTNLARYFGNIDAPLSRIFFLQFCSCIIASRWHAESIEIVRIKAILPKNTTRPEIHVVWRTEGFTELLLAPNAQNCDNIDTNWNAIGTYWNANKIISMSTKPFSKWTL